MAERSGTAKIAAGCDSGLLSRILRQAREKRKRTTNNNVVITLLLAFCKRLYILK